MENIIRSFATQSGLMPQIASLAIPMIARFFLKRSSPQKASGLMSMLPSSFTDAFSDDEKTEFTTKQENISQEDIIQELANKCFNGDKAQAEKAFQQVTKLLNEQTGKQGQDIIDDVLKNSGQGQV